MLRRRRLATLARALPALLAWSAGCEVLVNGQLHDIHCSDIGAVGPPACPVGFECRDDLCVPSGLGAPCRRDDDCAPGDLCLDPEILGADGAKRCSRTCCTSGDCDPDPHFVCWLAPGGGGSFCRPAPEVARAEGGHGKALEACARDADCRSGRCASKRCADTCCADTGCAAKGGTCRFGKGPADEADGFWCAPPEIDKKGRYASCKTGDECLSGLCIPLVDGGDGRCSAPCCGSSDCETFPDKATPVACAAVEVGGVRVRACSVLVPGKATSGVGSPCAVDSDCRSSVCDERGGVKRCGDACCTDASCGDPSSFVCRPVSGPASWALRCEPK